MFLLLLHNLKMYIFQKPMISILPKKQIKIKMSSYKKFEKTDNRTSLWWPSAAIVNFHFENDIIFKKETQTYFRILKHLSFQSNLQMK